ncbi:MAG: hypothetical protein JO264_01315 [Acidisphaera sp.]|nr:hypothetical protein [Acidisphaera sp.]
MTLPPGSWSESVCWSCDGPAEPDCAFVATLVADPKNLPDALGYPVVDSKREARVQVTVPRCRACRNRSRAGGIRMVCGMVLGAALLGGSYWWTGAHAGRPPWFVVVNQEFTTIVLLFAGAVVGTLACVFYAFTREPVARRSYDDFPPVAALRAAGWSWPSSE